MLIYFPHIPKAGGQTLLQCFYKAFGAKRCIKVWNTNFGADVSPDQFKDLSSENFKNIYAVIGHLPVRNFFKNDYAKQQFYKGNVKILTSVRNPIQRLVSLYNYINYNEKHPHHRNLSNTPPLEFIINQQANFQYNFLKSDLYEILTLSQILDMIDVFPLERSIDGFTHFFKSNLDIDVGKLDIKNSSKDLAHGKKLLSESDIPNDLLNHLTKKHKIDFELYYSL